MCPPEDERTAKEESTMTPKDLKNAILQLAIQGKLVEQRPEEAHVDLLGYKCQETDDYDLPEKWGIAYLETVSKVIPSKQYQILESEVRREGAFAVISQSKEYIIGYSDANDKLFHHDVPVVVFGDHTKEVKYVSFDFVIGADGVKVFEPVLSILTPKYLFYVLQFFTIGLKKVGGYSRHYKFIKTKPIPIPPLSEQRRIVAKIEELLPLVDRYEKAWTRLEDLNKRFPDDMQKSLLQTAIQGKLVEQRPEEGTGEELYKQIQAEKQSLIKSGKLKKEKPLPEITEDEKLFDIPEGWKWVRLPDVAEMCLGKMLDRQKNKGFSCPYLRNVNVRWGQFDLSDLLEMKFDDVSDERFLVRKGDLVMCEGGEPGRCAVWSGEPIHFQKALHRIRFYKDLVPQLYQFFFVYYSDSGVFNSLFTGTTIKHLTGQALDKVVIPLPPLAEQKRIVAKLQELLPLCEKLR